MADGDFDVDTLYPGYTNRLFQLESNNGRDPRSMDPDARNRGLGQFGREEEKRYGITDWRDPDQQRRGVNLEAAENYKILSNALGRPPTAAEMYLTHQQGQGGGPALLTADSSQPAWMAVRSKYPNSDIALQAIHDNVLSDSPLYHTPTSTIPAGDFRNMWFNKWNGGSGTWAGGPQGQGGQPSILPPGMAPTDQQLKTAFPGYNGGGNIALTPGVNDAAAAATASAQTGAGSSNPLVSAAMNLLQPKPVQPGPAMNLLSGPRGQNPFLQQLLAAMQQNQPGSSSPT